MFSNVELSRPPRCRPAQPTLYSTLETQSHRLDRPARRPRHAGALFEAPNWLRDGTDAALQQRRPDLPHRRPPAASRSHRHRLRHPLQQRPRRLARRHDARHQRPVAGRPPSRSSTRCRSPAARPGSSRRTARPTGTAGRPTARRSPICGERDGEFDIYTIPADGRRRDAADHRQGAGRRPGVLARRQVHLLQLRPHRHDADLADEARRQRAGTGHDRRVQQLVPPPLARRPVAGVPLLREGRRRAIRRTRT